MDDIVRQAMAKWPNVPDCYGWLGLDARGRWYLRDDAVQAQGDFMHSRGQLLEHSKLQAFIERNYAADARGCWFFQNGPQRVYVELEVTPWIWRLQPDGQVLTHTGLVVKPVQCLHDENDWVYLASDHGLGLVPSQDMALVAEAVEAGRWALEACQADELPQRFGFVRSPQALHSPAVG